MARRILTFSERHHIPLVSGFYLVAAAASTFPLVLHLSDTIATQGDPLLHSWILAWDVHALSSNPLHLYDANIFFPFPMPLTYSDAMLSGALTVAPVLLVTGNAVLAHNILTLLSLFLGAFGTFLLVRALTSSDLAGFLSGSIFGFCAARQAHLEHVNLLQFGWLPLALLYLHRVLTRGRTSDYAFFALFTILQALASFYLAWMMAIAYAVFILIELVSRRCLATVRRCAGAVAALLLASGIVIAVSWPYVLAHELFQYDWPMDMIRAFSATPSDYLSVPDQNLVYGSLLSQFANPYFPNEHFLFPGIAALVLSLVAVIRSSARVDVVRYGLIGLVAFVLSFGPSLQLDKHSDPIRLPYLYMLQFVPDFGVMRVPARFDFLVMLALAVLTGFGVAYVNVATARNRHSRQAVLLGIASIALLELVSPPVGVARVDVGQAVPAVYGWLRSQDPKAVIAEIPDVESGTQNNFLYEYMSTYHWHPLVNGSSGFNPLPSYEIRKDLDSFPDPTAVEHLRSLGVRFVIAHLDALEPTQIRQLNAADPGRLGLSVAASFENDVVYEMAPAASPTSLADHIRLELPTVVSRGMTPWITTTITNDTQYPLLVAPPEALSVRFEWDHAGSAASPRQDLPLFVDPGQELGLHFSTELDPTRVGTESATLRVRVSGSAELEATQRVQFADLPNSLQSSGLSGAAERVRVPPTAGVDSQIPIEVAVRNIGAAVWLPELPINPAAPGRVGVSVRNWIAPDGHVLPALGYSTAHLDWDVNPGQAAVFRLTTPAPHTPGHYQLVLDMLSEDVAWFSDGNGVTWTTIPVDVLP